MKSFEQTNAIESIPSEPKWTPSALKALAKFQDENFEGERILGGPKMLGFLAGWGVAQNGILRAVETTPKTDHQFYYVVGYYLGRVDAMTRRRCCN